MDKICLHCVAKTCTKGHPPLSEKDIQTILELLHLDADATIKILS